MTTGQGHTDTRETSVSGQKLTITVVSTTPELRADEKRTVKRQIESALYEVFRKYVSNRT